MQFKSQTSKQFLRLQEYQLQIKPDVYGQIKIIILTSTYFYFYSIPSIIEIKL